MTEKRIEQESGTRQIDIDTLKRKSRCIQQQMWYRCDTRGDEKNTFPNASTWTDKYIHAENDKPQKKKDSKPIQNAQTTAKWLKLLCFQASF